jgi:hypothetical protein
MAHGRSWDWRAATDDRAKLSHNAEQFKLGDYTELAHPSTHLLQNRTSAWLERSRSAR